MQWLMGFLLAVMLVASHSASAESITIHSPELGAIPALGNDNQASAGVALPPPRRIDSRSRLTPYVALPPESLEPRTLVVPLPSENGPPVVIRKGSVQAVPSIQPALPKSKASPDPGNITGNRRPLPPVVD